MPSPPPASMLAHFAALDDPRVSPATRHQLLDIVAIALCAVICGADTWVEVEAFGQAKRDWLETFLALPHGIPSHDTFGRVFAALDPDQFEAGFRSWVVAVAQLSAGAVVAIDGKTLRRSHDAAQGKGALVLVSAWAEANHLALGQVAVAEGSNEIPAIPALLQQLTLAGSIVTVDAIGCQTAIATQITQQDADYVLALKENQPTLHAAVAVLFTAGQATGVGTDHQDYRRTVEKGHGRIEVRQVWTVDDPEVIAYLNPDGAWPNLRSVAMVVAERRRGAESSRETRYYLSSLPGDATRVGAAIRGHWGIENRLHWVLDIAFREDESRVRQGHADQNLAVLRRLALNLLRQETTARMGTKAKRLKAGWDHAYLLKLLAG
ncbi:MAG: ISAs1 family transposase [Planctomycetes bacterium]|jgi:predicted transposase YbfD/YdcC|nr:ISAs1 family transposase [Planctomycetota bacterium]